MKIKVTNTGKIFYKEVEIIPYVRPDKGCLTVRINGRRLGVAKLVAQAFVENPNNYRNVIFKDRNRLNVCTPNLDWLSNKEYMLYCGAFTEKIIGEKYSAIEKAKCKFLKLFYETGDENYLIKCWLCCMKRITIYKFNEFQSIVWEYFKDRAYRCSIVDPHYLIVIYSKSARRINRKEINLVY